MQESITVFAEGMVSSARLGGIYTDDEGYGSIVRLNGGEKFFGGREEAVFLFAPLVGKWRTSAAESESSV